MDAKIYQKMNTHPCSTSWKKNHNEEKTRLKKYSCNKKIRWKKWRYRSYTTDRHSCIRKRQTFSVILEHPVITRLVIEIIGNSEESAGLSCLFSPGFKTLLSKLSSHVKPLHPSRSPLRGGRLLAVSKVWAASGREHRCPHRPNRVAS